MNIEKNNIPGTDFHWVFIWDNLTVHYSAYVHNTVTGHVGSTNFSIVSWPPFHSKYGRIEYKILEGGGRGGEGAVWSLCFVFCQPNEASKNLRTFQETSSRLPGTPLPAVTGLVVML
jgi:hypothetical protein